MLLMNHYVSKINGVINFKKEGDVSHIFCLLFSQNILVHSYLTLATNTNATFGSCSVYLMLII